MSGFAYPIVDLPLARRLERAEGLAGVAYVDARCVLHPGVGAEWIEVAGAVAMFDGATSPITQSFGLGLDVSFGLPDLIRVEEFFARHGCLAAHEISSFIEPTALNLLSARGYSPVEASTVLVRPTAPVSSAASGRISVRVIDGTESALWARVSGDGLRTESEELGAFVEDFGLIIGHAPGVHRFLAELDGEAIATASLMVSNGVALFGGASTIPQARRQGAQRALLEARLAFASDQHMDLAMIVTEPGTASQRNAERQGFRPVYTRSKWQRRPIELFDGLMHHDGYATTDLSPDPGRR